MESYLPHVAEVVWAMIIFGVFAHFMARSTCPAFFKTSMTDGPSIEVKEEPYQDRPKIVLAPFKRCFVIAYVACTTTLHRSA
eukprot:3496395-Amphidinium_carterae.1